MKLVGMLVALLGWAIAVGGLSITASTGGRIVFCLVGISVAIFGILGIINKAHLKEAIWKH
ncbi:MAG TPA: hypothetical protein VH088_06505 [Terriglobales bacterium]|jgi:hypothetical protein|nr:hypothetical protein [Terriglobales bacterium]